MMKYYLCLIYMAVLLGFPNAHANFYGPEFYGTGILKPQTLSVTSGLAVWLKPEAGITLDTSMATNTVSRWTNMATTGTGYDVAQSTKVSQPIRVNHCKNGYACHRFDAIDDSMSFSGSGLSLLNNVSGCTVFAVLKSNGTSLHQAIFNASTNSGTLTRLLFRRTNTLSHQVVARRLDADTSQNFSGGSYDTVNFNVLSMIADWSNSNTYIYKDGINVLTELNFLTAGNTSATDSSVMQIGVINGSNYLNSDLVEMLIYQRALSATERKQVEQYLGAKYGITLQ